MDKTINEKLNELRNKSSNSKDQNNLENQLTKDSYLKVAQEYSNNKIKFSNDKEVIDYLVNYMNKNEEYRNEIISKLVSYAQKKGTNLDNKFNIINYPQYDDEPVNWSKDVKF